MKIFVIGFNKTGTSSFHELFIQSGINSTHTTIPVMNIINDFDAFTDGTHYESRFKEYYYKYPSSLFILNTRPIGNWLISRYKHAKTKNFEDSWCWPISEEKTNNWIKDREHHYKKIFEFFLDKPKQLLIVNIEKKGWEGEVLKFINKPIICKSFHHHKTNFKNKQQLLDEITKNVNECLMDEGYTGDEPLIKGIDIKSYEYSSNL
jgi:hypothetical protein